jgi:signal transduction histidine kinase
MDNAPEDSAKAIEAIGRIDVVPTLLAVLCETTGMRFSVVACVTDTTWTACAVQDEIGFGVKRGDQLAVSTTLCSETRASRVPIVIEHASADPLYHAHPAVKLYPIESHISVPIILSNGRYFGNLCAIDPSPAKVKEPRILSMFTRFASLIASQLETQLRQEQEHTALLDERAVGELREQFIAILGHDLRNPLQAVYAGCDLLEQKITDPRLSMIASRIKTNVRRMSALIDDVLDFARGRLGGGLDVELTEVENINSGLLTVVQEVLDARPDCKIISDIDVGRPVRCDLGRLQQVASNLLTNAAMHGLPHSAIKITATADDDDLLLAVWNAGEPIPPESIDKIFQPFWRHSVSANRNGLGLGLHICSQIVRAHKGSISVTSSPEDGTRFTARLPLGVSQKAKASLATASPTEDQRQRPSLLGA